MEIARKGLGAVVVVGLLACAGGGALAATLPMEYSGRYDVEVTVRNSFGSNTCAGSASLTIRLGVDGKVAYEAAGLVTQIDEPTGRAPTCQLLLSGKTTVLSGTHDGVAGFRVPAGGPGLPDLTGRFDDSHITGDYRLGSTVISFDLPAVSHRIAFEPDPADGFKFQLSILDGQGFKLVVRDPLGRDHLDWRTLQIRVGGTDAQPGPDVTAHVLSRLTQGIVPFRDESPDARTRVIRLVPDPQRLQQGHDVFAIPFNGDWRIELRICDLAGTCFNKVYVVYFGPFVSTLGVADRRCRSNGPEPLLDVVGIEIGNIGIDSPNAQIFVGLAAADGRDLWTYHFGDFGSVFAGFAWWQNQVRPFVPQISIPSGYLLRQTQQLLMDDVAIPAGATFDRRVPFPAGEFRFVTAALDRDTGSYRRVERNVRMCD